MSKRKDEGIPLDWQLVCDEETISRCLARISYEILEKDRDLEKLAIVGIRTAGEFLAQRVRKRIEEIEKRRISHGVIDITLYRDDLLNSNQQPLLKGTELPFQITGSRIVLIDDVLFTGRTVRAALDAIIDFGRPSCVELGVLIDRGHKELPIRADYVGKNLPTSRKESVKIRLKESGYINDGVYLVRAK